LSEAGIVPGEEKERFIDAVGKRSFVFDHISLVSAHLFVAWREICQSPRGGWCGRSLDDPA
jgi:hypothetical protein